MSLRRDQVLVSEQSHKLHPKCDSTSAGMVEIAIKQVKEKVQNFVISTRELHGVVMDLEHLALAWCVCVSLFRSFPVLSRAQMD